MISDTRPVRRPVMALAVILAVVALALLGLATIGADPAPADGGNNVAVAVNTKDGTTRFKVRLQIRRDDGSVVDSSNVAVAFASCTDCRAIAAAFQIVLVTNDATELTPTNLALALNEGCSGCESLASAYQFVYGIDDDVRFTAAGRDELHDIRKALKALRDDDLSIEEIQAQLDDLAARLAHVLTSELTVGGRQIESVPPPPSEPVPEEPTTSTATNPEESGSTTSAPSTTTSPPTVPTSTTTTTTTPPSTTTTTTSTTPLPSNGTSG